MEGPGVPAGQVREGEDREVLPVRRADGLPAAGRRPRREEEEALPGHALGLLSLADPIRIHTLWKEFNFRL